MFQEDIIAKRLFRKPFMDLEQDQMDKVYAEIETKGLDAVDNERYR